jgi:hypothetical protein
MQKTATWIIFSIFENAVLKRGDACQRNAVKEKLPKAA